MGIVRALGGDMRGILLLLLVGCGGGGEDTVPLDTDDGEVTGCQSTDMGELLIVHELTMDCMRCPEDWECAIYSQQEQTKCFLPCDDTTDCDECLPDTGFSGASCKATSIGDPPQEVRICK
jgi:hypothetical protein